MADVSCCYTSISVPGGEKVKKGVEVEADTLLKLLDVYVLRETNK